jgi:hypothetical protein
LLLYIAACYTHQPFDPHNAVSYSATMQNTIFAYAEPLLCALPLQTFSAQSVYIMEHFSSPHKHIAHKLEERRSMVGEEKVAV